MAADPVEHFDVIMLDKKWFCGISSVVVVRVKVTHDNSIRYYIGAPNNPSETGEANAATVAAWGVRFPDDAGDVLFGV